MFEKPAPAYPHAIGWPFVLPCFSYPWYILFEKKIDRMHEALDLLNAAALCAAFDHECCTSSFISRIEYARRQILSRSFHFFCVIWTFCDESMIIIFFALPLWKQMKLQSPDWFNYKYCIGGKKVEVSLQLFDIFQRNNFFNCCSLWSKCGLQ